MRLRRDLQLVSEQGKTPPTESFELERYTSLLITKIIDSRCYSRFGKKLGSLFINAKAAVEEMKHRIKSSSYYINLSIACEKVIQGQAWWAVAYTEQVDEDDIIIVLGHLDHKMLQAIRKRSTKIYPPIAKKAWIEALGRAEKYSGFFSDQKLRFLGNYGIDCNPKERRKWLQGELVADFVRALRQYERLMPEDQAIGYALKTLANSSKKLITFHTAKKRNRMSNTDGEFLMTTVSLDSASEEGFSLDKRIASDSGAHEAYLSYRDCAESIIKECKKGSASVMLALMGFSDKYLEDYVLHETGNVLDALSRKDKLTVLCKFYCVNQNSFMCEARTFLSEREKGNQFVRQISGSSRSAPISDYRV